MNLGPTVLVDKRARRFKHKRVKTLSGRNMETLRLQRKIIELEEDLEQKVKEHDEQSRKVAEFNLRLIKQNKQHVKIAKTERRRAFEMEQKQKESERINFELEDKVAKLKLKLKLRMEKERSVEVENDIDKDRRIRELSEKLKAKNSLINKMKKKDEETRRIVIKTEEDKKVMRSNQKELREKLRNAETVIMKQKENFEVELEKKDEELVELKKKIIKEPKPAVKITPIVNKTETIAENNDILTVSEEKKEKKSKNYCNDYVVVNDDEKEVEKDETEDEDDKEDKEENPEQLIFTLGKQLYQVKKRLTEGLYSSKKEYNELRSIEKSLEKRLDKAEKDLKYGSKPSKPQLGRSMSMYRSLRRRELEKRGLFGVLSVPKKRTLKKEAFAALNKPIPKITAESSGKIEKILKKNKKKYVKKMKEKEEKKKKKKKKKKAYKFFCMYKGEKKRIGLALDTLFITKVLEVKLEDIHRFSEITSNDEKRLVIEIEVIGKVNKIYRFDFDLETGKKFEKCLWKKMNIGENELSHNEFIGSFFEKEYRFKLNPRKIELGVEKWMNYNQIAKIDRMERRYEIQTEDGELFVWMIKGKKRAEAFGKLLVSLLKAFEAAEDDDDDDEEEDSEEESDAEEELVVKKPVQKKIMKLKINTKCKKKRYSSMSSH